MRLIDADPLYEKVQHDEELARNRVLDTESTLPYPNNLNPSYTRYVAQMDERTKLKHMIADAPTIEPETEEEAYERGYTAGQMAQRKTERWIPVSDRLPEENGEYLVTREAKGIYKYVDIVKKTNASGDIASDIVAWMPLPEPYREEGGER